MFDRLYERYHQRIFGLCYRFTGNSADAEEMLQEAFLRMLHKVRQFDGRSAFSTWFYRLTMNALLNEKRHRSRRPALQAEDASLEPQAPVSDPDLRMALERALGALPDGYRQVFVLHDQEGFDHSEIAEILGCSVSNSKSQLSRARAALRQKLSGVLGGAHA